jgi:enoyl-CoA hydratase/carnithine racemase
MSALRPYIVKQLLFENKILKLTLNRPETMNTLSIAMMDALQFELDSLKTCINTRVVIIGGSGRAFCAGHDLSEMVGNKSESFYERLFKQCSDMMLSIQHLPQPVIAEVNGIATAAGCQLVSTCDLAVASNQAKFAVSGINLGLFCSTPSVALSRNVSRKHALEMLLTGDFIDSHEALSKGIINKTVDASELESSTLALGIKIAQKSTSAIHLGKQLFYKQMQMKTADAYKLASDTMVQNIMNIDAQDGISSFLQKKSASKETMK